MGRTVGRVGDRDGGDLEVEPAGPGAPVGCFAGGGLAEGEEPVGLHRPRHGSVQKR